LESCANPSRKFLQSWNKWPCFLVVEAVEAVTVLVVVEAEVEADEVVGVVAAVVGAATMVADTAVAPGEDTLGAEEDMGAADVTGGELSSTSVIRLILHNQDRFGSVL